MRRRQKEVMKSANPEAFTGIYAEIAAQIDRETAVRIYEMLRGQVVIFPQKLYDRDYVRTFVWEHRSEYSIRELSRMFGYSDRRIRQFIAEEKEQTAQSGYSLTSTYPEE